MSIISLVSQRRLHKPLVNNIHIKDFRRFRGIMHRKRRIVFVILKLCTLFALLCLCSMAFGSLRRMYMSNTLMAPNFAKRPQAPAVSSDLPDALKLISPAKQETAASHPPRELPPAQENEYVLRRPDGHGGTVRVMFALLTSKLEINFETCFAVASAYFTDLPVVVAGYGEFYLQTRRFEFAMAAASLAGLNDSDVIFVMDSDFMFTGQDMMPYIDKFIAKSAASPDELDAKAVREGKAMAPSIFSSEINCYAPQQYECDRQLCEDVHLELEKMSAEYAQQHDGAFKPVLSAPGELPRYINSGISMHRLWSLKELNVSLTKFITINAPICPRDLWLSDQSAIIALYVDLRRWEIRQNVFMSGVNSHVNTRYGLRAGQVQMDAWNELTAVIPYDLVQDFELTSERWGGQEHKRLANIFSNTVFFFVDDVWQGKGGALKLMQRNLSRESKILSSIDFTPPLLSVKPRHAHGLEEPPVRVFPLIMHYAGGAKEYRIAKTLYYTPWYIPMRYDKLKWNKGHDYLLSLPVELWSMTTKKRIKFSDLCSDHPFNGKT